MCGCAAARTSPATGSPAFPRRDERLSERARREQCRRRTRSDRDGSVLKELPPVWSGLTAAGRRSAGGACADRTPADACAYKTELEIRTLAQENSVVHPLLSRRDVLLVPGRRGVHH